MSIKFNRNLEVNLADDRHQATLDEGAATWCNSHGRYKDMNNGTPL